MSKNSEKRSTSSTSSKTSDKKSERKRKHSVQRTAMGLDMSLRGSGVVVVKGKEVLLSRRLPTEPIPAGAVGKAGICGLRERRDGGKVYRGEDEDCIEYLRKFVKRTFLKYEPDIVVLENYAFVKNSKALSVLHEVGGVVKNQLHRMEAPWVSPRPSEVKAFACGDGGASKADMLLKARREGYEFRNSDEADGFWLARWGIENYETIFE